MFDRFKKKPDPEKPKVAGQSKSEVSEKPQRISSTSKNAKKEEKRAKTPSDTAPKVHTDVKAVEKPFASIKEYSSAVETVEKIDKEIAATKSTLAEYLRQLDNVRSAAEKTKRLHDLVAELAGKKQPREASEQIKVNGLEIVLDATPLNELTAIESVVKSHQNRLQYLQKAKEALEPLDQFGDTDGIRYLVLEKEGIPEQILLKIS